MLRREPWAASPEQTDAVTNHLISPTAVEADAADIGRRRQAQADTCMRGRPVG